MSDEELFNSIKQQLNDLADKYNDLIDGPLSFQALFGWISLYNIIFKHNREGLEDYLNSVFQEIKEKIEKTAKDRKNRQYVILADGSVFIVHDNSTTNYYKYWKVYYDTIRVPACQNIFHMVREQKHILRSYSYVSGPTESLPDEDYWVEKDYCTGYEMHETINIFWKEGDVFYGDKPRAVYFPGDHIDPLGEAFEKMKASLGTITDDGQNVKVKQTATDDDGSQVITETTLPASFFTQPHTLSELINLGLVVGDFNPAELYSTLSPEDVDFIIEIYGVKK